MRGKFPEEEPGKRFVFGGSQRHGPAELATMMFWRNVDEYLKANPDMKAVIRRRLGDALSVEFVSGDGGTAG